MNVTQNQTKCAQATRKRNELMISVSITNYKLAQPHELSTKRIDVLYLPRRCISLTPRLGSGSAHCNYIHDAILLTSRIDFYDSLNLLFYVHYLHFFYVSALASVGSWK